MRILIVGLGAIGQRHARNLRRLLGADADLLALRRRGGGAALSDALGPDPGVLPEESLDIRVLHDMDSALAERPDAVIVSDPTSMHLASASAALDSGLPMLIEKPLSHSWEGIPEFLEQVSRSGVVALVGYQLRFHPLLERARSLVGEGELGSVISASATYGEYLPGWHPYEDYRKGYAARRDLGGGVVLTQIHDIDYLGWILGWPRHVYSVGGHLSGLEVDVDDTAVSLWPCDIQGRAVPVQLRQDYVRRQPCRGLELVLDEGMLDLDLLAHRLRVVRSDGVCVVDETLDGYDRNDMFLAEMRHFLACVDGREQPLVPPVEAARSLAVALAALRSQASGIVEAVIYP
jgi:predicted dehydrogenase